MSIEQVCMERLETRRLLSSINYEPMGGFINVYGDSGANQIVIGEHFEGNIAYIDVTIDGVGSTFLRQSLVPRGFINFVNVWGRSGNDTITNNWNPGIDPNSAGQPSVGLYGEDGDDVITNNDPRVGQIGGASWYDIVSGGIGNDILLLSTASEQVIDDGGSDTISYANHVQGVTVHLVGSQDAQMGDAGELDKRVGTFEKVYGGSGADVLDASGVTYPVELVGNDGNDTIKGGSANDNLRGSMGNDSLEGSAGNDWFVAGQGDDVVFGGDGNDTIYGGAGRDDLRGNYGDDWIYSRDSEIDTITAGNGFDYAQVDAIDLVAGVESLLA